jgi:adenosine deaminase
MLEVCPTSNVLLGVAESIAQHPLPALLAAGLNVSINTDDPGSFGTDLNTELQLAHAHHGVTLEQLRAMQLAALEASFADPSTKVALRDEIERYRSVV